jgi:hypothetical protein
MQTHLFYNTNKCKKNNHSKIPNSKTPNNMISRYEVLILDTKDPTKNILNDNTKHDIWKASITEHMDMLQLAKGFQLV